MFRRWSVPWLFSAALLWAVAEAIAPFSFKPYSAIAVARFAPWTQIAELGGPTSVSALIVLANVILLEFGQAALRRTRPPRGSLVGTFIVIAVLGIGCLRLHQVQSISATAPTVRVGVLQPNFGIVRADERKAHGRLYVATLREATMNLAALGADLVLWPESAWPYVLDRTMQREFPAGHPWELRGKAPVRLLFGTLSQVPGTAEMYNSAVLIAQDGRIAGRNDRKELVPFGEYIPFRQQFPEWAARTRKRLPLWPDITPGTNANLLVDGNLRMAVTICAEDLSIGRVRELALQNPNLLVCIASDAWFGDSAAPWQHLALASFRAIETRRSFIRCCNTGVSAYIDATGRVRQHTNLTNPSPGKPVAPELMIVEVPLLDIPTPFLKYHKYFPWGCLVSLVAIAGLSKYRLSRQREKCDHAGQQR